MTEREEGEDGEFKEMTTIVIGVGGETREEACNNDDEPQLNLQTLSHASFLP